MEIPPAETRFGIARLCSRRMVSAIRNTARIQDQTCPAGIRFPPGIRLPIPSNQRLSAPTTFICPMQTRSS